MTIKVKLDDGDESFFRVSMHPEKRWANPAADAASVATSMTMVQGGTAFSWGSNAMGLLGNNVPDAASVAFLPVHVRSSDDSPLTLSQVAIGGQRAAAIDITGLVWTWGSASQGSGTDAVGTMYGATPVRATCRPPWAGPCAEPVSGRVPEPIGHAPCASPVAPRHNVAYFGGRTLAPVVSLRQRGLDERGSMAQIPVRPPLHRSVWPLT